MSKEFNKQSHKKIDGFEAKSGVSVGNMIDDFYEEAFDRDDIPF